MARARADAFEYGALRLGVLLPQLGVDADPDLRAARAVMRAKTGTVGTGQRLLLERADALLSQAENVDDLVAKMDDALDDRLLWASARAHRARRGGRGARKQHRRLTHLCCRRLKDSNGGRRCGASSLHE